MTEAIPPLAPSAVPPALPNRVEKLILELPKVELHVHLEGSLPPALLLQLGAKYGLTNIPRDESAVRSWYEFRDFPHFIEVYRTAVQVLNDEEDFARLAGAVLESLARQNVRYAEVTVSLHDHLERGVSAATVFAGLEIGRRQAEHHTGISVRWLPDFAGDRGVAAGERTLDAVLAHGPDSVLGFGVGGPEVERDQFRAVFARAKRAGYKSFPHAGETHGPDRVWSAIRALGADRIGHGIRSVDDPNLVAHLVDTQLPVDISPTSNLRTRAVAGLASHPLPELLRRGVLVTLNSDDPPMFGTTLLDEYRTAYRMGLSEDELVTLANNAVTASFAPDQLKTSLRAEIATVAGATPD